MLLLCTLSTADINIHLIDVIYSSCTTIKTKLKKEMFLYLVTKAVLFLSCLEMSGKNRWFSFFIFFSLSVLVSFLFIFIFFASDDKQKGDDANQTIKAMINNKNRKKGIGILRKKNLLERKKQTAISFSWVIDLIDQSESIQTVSSFTIVSSSPS